MPRVRRTEETLYTLDELCQMNGEDSEVVQTAVREVTCTDDYEWWDSTYEYWVNLLDSIGIPDADIRFSGFWSQGDGASFTTGQIDLEKFVQFALGEINPEGTEFVRENLQEFNYAHRIQWCLSSEDFLNTVEAKMIRQSHRYCHENTCCLERQYTYSDEVNEVVNDLMETLENFCLWTAAQIYRGLEAEYEYLTSLESAQMQADANGFEFTAEGKLA